MQDSLQGRFVRVALIAVLLPLIVFGAAVMTLAEREVREDALEMHRTVLDSVISGTTIYLNARRQRLAELAREPDLQSLQPERIEPRLAELLAADAFFRALLIAGADGRVLSVRARRQDDPLFRWTGRIPDPETDGVLARRLTDGYLQGGGGPGRDLLLIQTIESFAEPGSCAGRLIGVASLSGPDFQDVLATLPVRSGEYIALLDEAGRILARHGDSLPDDARAFLLPTGVPGLGMTPQDGQVVTFSLDRGPVADQLSISYSPLLTCWIAIGRTESRAFGRLHSLRIGFLLAALLGVVLAVAAGWLAGRSLSGPVTRLTEALRRIRDGEYAYRVELESGGELQEAGTALNDLAELMERRQLVGTIWEKLRREDGRP